MEVVNLNNHYYYEQLYSDALLLAKLYPTFVTCQTIGESVEGRKIVMLRLGKGEKSLICSGGVHGRESINPIVLMKVAERYCTKYFEKRDPLLQKFFEEYNISFIPLLNPDGYMIALRGYNIIRDETLRLEAKGKGIPYWEWKYNARGVDLNRNFPSVDWAPRDEDDYPASEPETRVLMDFFAHVKSVGYIDYHSRGELIYYYRNQMSKAYNERQKAIAERICDMTKYTLAKPEEEIETGDCGGNTVHYYSEGYLKPALTIETVPDLSKFPLNIRYQELVYKQVYLTPFSLVKDMSCYFDFKTI